MDNIKLTPYFRAYRERIEDNTDELKKLKAATSSLLVPSPNKNVFFIDNTETKMSQWLYPITINESAFLDIRPYVNSRNEINNFDMVHALTNQALLELEWQQELSRFVTIEGNVSSLFGSWLTQLLAQRYGMTARDSFLFQIGFTAYYLSIFSTQSDIENYWNSVRRRLDRYTLIPRDIVDEFEELTDQDGKSFLDILKETSREDRLEKLCSFLNEIIGTPLNHFSPKLLSEMVSFSWIGPSAAVNCIISLYHPVPFIEMLSRAVENSYYNNKTNIGKTVKVNKKASIDEVSKFVKMLNAENKI